MTNNDGVSMDNTNHDLVHALSVRLDASWHDRSYHDEVDCDGCRHAFEMIREMDERAIRLLTDELTAHVRHGKFPVVLMRS